ncbi:profilin [Aplysia californica]|uniref:Profilin n=1 Tax=Aplysia californica TaxID=6500 RepID=A0ABM1ACQ4_APLCA|nr:profilin [Aplysia californica]
MSWDAYVKSLEDGSAKCTYAGIYGRQGGCWAESENKSTFNITQEQISQAVNIISTGDQSVYGNGITLGQAKFTCLKLDVDSLLLQGKSPDWNDYSLVISLTATGVIIGLNHTPEVKTQTVCTAVEGMKDYLKNVGY